MKRELPRGWELKRLDDVAKYINGRAFKPSEWGDIGRPIIRIQNLTDDLKSFNYFNGECEQKYCIKNGDILISWSASLGIFVWGRNDAVLNQHIFKAIPDEKIIDKRFFIYVIQTVMEYMKRRTHGSTMKHIVKSEFNKIEIPLPPLPTQQKIVTILDKTEATKKFRTQADELTNQLLHSGFLEMFGDPAKNPKGWEIKKMETEIEDIRYGTGSPPEYQEEGIPFIRATNIKRGTIQKEGLAHISEDEAQKIPKCKVKTGDLILVRSGVNTGDCVVIPNEYNGAYAAYDLIIEIPFPKNYYYDFLINSEYGKSIISSLSRRAGQPHINAEQVKSLRFQLPPIHLLENFVQFVEKVKTIRNNQRQSKKEIDILFNILMQKAFTGELVA